MEVASHLKILINSVQKRVSLGVDGTTTGFPEKDARFSKLKIIPGLRADIKDGKIM